MTKSKSQTCRHKRNPGTPNHDIKVDNGLSSLKNWSHITC